MLEVDPAFQQDPATLHQLYVKSASGAQVPLSALTKVSQKAVMAIATNKHRTISKTNHGMK